VFPNTVVVSLIGKVVGTAAVDTGMPLPEGTPGGLSSGFVGTSYYRSSWGAPAFPPRFNDQRQAFGDNVLYFHRHQFSDLPIAKSMMKKTTIERWRSTVSSIHGSRLALAAEKRTYTGGRADNDGTRRSIKETGHHPCEPV